MRISVKFYDTLNIIRDVEGGRKKIAGDGRGKEKRKEQGTEKKE